MLKDIKNKVLLINMLIALCLLIMSFSFTFAYFTYSKQSEISFTAGKINFAFKNNNESIKNFKINDLVYVDYYDDVMNDKTNTLDNLITYYDLDIVNESNVENVSISINLSLVFANEAEASTIICQIIPMSIIDDNFSYVNYFKGDYTKKDNEESGESIKNEAISSHKESMNNKNGIVKEINGNAISFLLFNKEVFSLNETKSYRLVFLADYDEAAKNALENNANSFSHQYDCMLKIKAGQSEEFE